ncbi:serine/threonine kinase [Fischerella sp. NIES-4106]|nr:serine/threonine kinase [Fischerella sp. NIES-4106]
MSYCINPKCRQRYNPDESEICLSCGTSLLINNRYRVNKRIKSNQSVCTEIFEVKDLTPKDSDEKKILKIIYDDDSQRDNGEKKFTILTRLFKREQDFLTENRNPGIPLGYDKFSLTLSNGKEIHCLVMEKVKGINLEEWVENNGAITQERTLRWLKQIVDILDFIHEEKDFFHRDIKPSNIMRRQIDQKLVLIDFGTVKEICFNQHGSQITTQIGTPGYQPPEQSQGQAEKKSDFYALGRTFVYLLTGKQPRQMETEGAIYRWYEHINSPISQSLIKLINDLMEEHISKRPEDTQTILARLDHIQEEIAKFPSSISSKVVSQTPTNPPQHRVASSTPTNRPQLENQQRRDLIKSVAIAFGVIGIALLIPLLVGRNNQAQNKDIPIMPLTSPSTTLLSEGCDFKLGDNISCGEESLISQSGQMKDPPQEKVQGMGEIKEGNYSKAQELLEKAWNQTFEDGKPDPETLIYLNNAKIHNLINQQKNSQQKIYTIAVAAPLKYIKEESDIFNQGLEMLRGVAQAQDKVIKEEGIYLQVAIANDANNIEKAPEIAEQLGKNQDILGVIGHYSSSITQAALPKYQENGLTLVSPASTSVKLSGQKNLYRIAPDDAVAGLAIAEDLKNKPNPQIVAIFWSKGEAFSESLKGEAERGLGIDRVVNYNIENSEIFNLASDNFNVENALNEAKKQGVTAIILIPDGGQTKALTNAYAVIQANKDPNFIFIGGDTLYNSRTIENVKKNAAKNQLIIAVSWHPLNNELFSKSTEKLWRTKDVSWLTATAYDASLVLTEAIKQDPSRKGVNKIISAAGFKVNQGATGEISFNESDRADPKSTLVKVLPYCQPGSGYRFVPVNYPKKCISS